MRKFRATATLRHNHKLCGSIFIEFEHFDAAHARRQLECVGVYYWTQFHMTMTVTDMIEVE